MSYRVLVGSGHSSGALRACCICGHVTAGWARSCVAPWSHVSGRRYSSSSRQAGAFRRFQAVPLRILVNYQLPLRYLVARRGRRGDMLFLCADLNSGRRAISMANPVSGQSCQRAHKRVSLVCLARARGGPTTTSIHLISGCEGLFADERPSVSLSSRKVTRGFLVTARRVTLSIVADSAVSVPFGPCIILLSSLRLSQQ